MLDMSQLTILVADPNPHMVKIFRAMLRGFGSTRVLEAQDGALALEELKSNLVDIAVVDYALTTINGVELTELIRGDKRSANRFVPIILVSAYTEKWRIEECRDAGITEFLRKPLCARDLHDRICEIVRNPRPFVRSAKYFGPDRRRRDSANYARTDRREPAPNEQQTNTDAKPKNEQDASGAAEKNGQSEVDALFA